MAIELDGRGLEQVNFSLAQKASFMFDVVHEGDDGEVVDHSGSAFKMAFQGKDTYQADECVSATSERIRISIPASVSGALPIGTLNWDMFADTISGESIRICSGKVKVVDTYAKDGE